VAPVLAAATAHLDPAVYGAVVLGCTHFPYFRPHLAARFPGVPLVDGNRGTVNNLCAQLQARFPDCGNGAEPGAVAYFESGRAADPARFQKYLDYFKAL
jgi:glutamate racemase